MHVLKNVLTSSRLSPRRRKHITACWTRARASRRRTRRAMRDPGESPDLQFCLLNSVLAERAAQGSIRTARTNPYRGLHLADGTLFWVVFADSERDLRWLGSRGCPVRLAPSGTRSPKGGYRSSSVARLRKSFATGRDQLPVIVGQPRAARWNSRCVRCMAVPLIESI